MALGTGSGDFVGNQQECHWDKLPWAVLESICEHLDWRDRNHLRRLSKDMQDFMEYDYGIHVLLPPRNWSVGQWSILRLVLGRLAGAVRQVTDGMIKRRILNMEGKVIRSLEMNEMHPEFTPFPFQRLLQRPYRLRNVRLKYLDAQFLYQLMNHCKYIHTLYYETGLQRHLPDGPLSWVFLGSSFQPVPIPSENGNLIRLVAQLPATPFQVERLTSLSLSLQRIHTLLHSDWANIIFLLLLLSSSPLVALQKFKFAFNPGWYPNLKDALQIVACIGQFLSRCPHLQHFEYESSCNYADYRIQNWFDITTGLPQNVISFLIQKYGSELLNEVCQPEVLGWRERMLTPIREIMREAGGALRNLQDVTFKFWSRYETDVYKELASCLPSLRKFRMDDFSEVSFHSRMYRLLLPSVQENIGPTQPVYKSIEKLYICRRSQYTYVRNRNNNRIISLVEVVDKMRALKHLEVVPKVPDNYRRLRARADLNSEHDPTYYLNDIERDLAIIGNDHNEPADGSNRVANITIEDDATDETIFQQLEVLRLEGVKFTTLAAARLVRWRNLKELFLLFITEYRHRLFGIRSGDLLRILGSLRKLDKVFVNMILLPRDDDLSLVHRGALQEIGELKQMKRLIEEGWGPLPRTETLQQYKFLFRYDQVLA